MQFFVFNGIPEKLVLVLKGKYMFIALFGQGCLPYKVQLSVLLKYLGTDPVGLIPSAVIPDIYRKLGRLHDPCPGLAHKYQLIYMGTAVSAQDHKIGRSKDRKYPLLGKPSVEGLLIAESHA